MIFMHEFGNDEGMDEGRIVALNIPFTQRIWKTEKYFCWYVCCPGEYTNGLLRYVNDKFSKVPGRLEVLNINSEAEFISPIPYTLFDERSGNWRYEPKSALSVIKK